VNEVPRRLVCVGVFFFLFFFFLLDVSAAVRRWVTKLSASRLCGSLDVYIFVGVVVLLGVRCSSHF
jgi:hypothetical protein